MKFPGLASTMSDEKAAAIRAAKDALRKRCGATFEELSPLHGYGEPASDFPTTLRTLLDCVDALERRIATLEREALTIRDPVSSVVVGNHPPDILSH